MAALKWSLAKNQVKGLPQTKKKRGRTADRRQGSLLLPVKGGGKRAEAPKETQKVLRRRRTRQLASGSTKLGSSYFKSPITLLERCALLGEFRANRGPCL
jgi:hypothetical protein